MQRNCKITHSLLESRMSEDYSLGEHSHCKKGRWFYLGVLRFPALSIAGVRILSLLPYNKRLVLTGGDDCAGSLCLFYVRSTARCRGQTNTRT